jgi:DNA-binding CsgD family transcriptional regulator
MDIMISSDPWDGLEVNLSTFTLTEREKIWIGQEIASGRKTPKSLAKRFNLNRKKIQWYGKMAKKGKVPRSQVGRPPRIDQIGVVKLLSISTNASDDEKKTLKEEIRAQAVETHKRRVEQGNNDNYVEVSKTTLVRYAKNMYNR